MGLIRSLFPWYKWSDRWAHNVFDWGEANAIDGIDFTCPVGERHEIIGVSGEAEGHALGSGFAMRLEVWRGSIRFAVIRASFTIAAGARIDFFIGTNLPNVTRDTGLDTYNWGLPDNIILLPFDQLRLRTSSSSAGDQLNIMSITSKKWED